MSCFEYTFKKCRGESSDARVLDDIFNTLSNYDLSTMFDNPQKSINIATEMAYNSMVTALISKEGKEKAKRNIILGNRFLESYSKGDYVQLIADKKQQVRINKIHLNVDYTGLLIFAS